MMIKMETLNSVLSQMFNKEVRSADFRKAPLQGGTVAKVELATGTAETADGDKRPYRVVLKTQKKWERFADPDSWRREYDLYASELGATFTDAFCWPACYHAEMNEEENEYRLWLAYIDGITGLDLTVDMCEHAALELGRYQGRLYAEKPAALQRLNNLSDADLMKKTYWHYRSWPLVYDYVRSEDCAFPVEVRQMFIDLDQHADEIFARIEKLPRVFCHKDYWVTNLIFAESKIAIIDWDTAGWGHLGEDLASLIGDEADVDHMVDLYRRCIPAYYKGFSEYADVSSVTDHCVYEMILLRFGYRLVEWYLHAEDDEEKSLHARTLEIIHEMKDMAVWV